MTFQTVQERNVLEKTRYTAYEVLFPHDPIKGSDSPPGASDLRHESNNCTIQQANNPINALVSKSSKSHASGRGSYPINLKVIKRYNKIEQSEKVHGENCQNLCDRKY